MDWRKLVSDSLVSPRAAARAAISLRVPRGRLLEAAVAVTALGVILGFAAVVVGPTDVDQVSAAIVNNPLVGAAMQLSILLLAAFLTDRIGTLFGGTGNFDGALTIVVLLNAMLLLIQSVQFAALLLFPPLAGLLAVAAVVWALWAFANFVAELHGFQNAFFVLGGVILSMIVLFFGLAMLLALLGFTPQDAV